MPELVIMMVNGSQLTDRLDAWFAANARALPWRDPTTSAWQVLISEIMLQQTPVVRVLPVYLAWIHRWPTPRDLAAEPAGEAIRMWGKLGYPRRALRLHSAAAVLERDHDGVVPDELPALLALPGVGAYTARAVLAFAYGRRTPVVDINVRRVLARAVEGKAQPGAPATTRDLAAMELLLPSGESSAARFCAAVMELGAVCCTAATPRCTACPIQDACRWRLAGSPSHPGPVPVSQKFAGTDRQVRGLLLDVVRADTRPVLRTQLDLVWPHAAQRDRALASLLSDGLIEQHSDDRFSLPT